MKNNSPSVHRRHKTIDVKSKEQVESELFSLTLIKFFLGLKTKVCALFKNEQQVSSHEDKALVMLFYAIIKRSKEVLCSQAYSSIILRI
jgi:hypothetical protein